MKEIMLEDMLARIVTDLSQLTDDSLNGRYDSLFHLRIMAEAKAFQKLVIDSDDIEEEYKRVMIDRLINEFELSNIELS